jgi:hypothetical protein
MMVHSLAVSNPGFTAISKAIAAEGNTLGLEATDAIARRSTWAALGATNGAGLGSIWLMVARPESVESLDPLTSIYELITRWSNAE